MRPTREFRKSLLLSVVTLLACSSSGGPVRVEPVPQMTQLVSFTITQGLEPEIRWSPDSGLGWLHVGRRDKNQIVWEIRTRDSTNSLRQPIRYGIVPPEAELMTAPTTLEAGVEYEISVGRFQNFLNSFGLVQVARIKFRPHPSSAPN